MKFLALIISLFSVVFFFFPKNSFASSFYLEESFKDDDFFEDWTEYKSHNSPLCDNSWRIENGVLISNITQLGCASNLFPSDAIWQDIGSEYEVEFDVWFISGIDHNFALRFDPQSGRFYEYHFQSPNSVGLGGGPPAAEPLIQNPRVVSYPIPNKPDPYHIKIIYRKERVELYIDGVFVHKRDIDVSSPFNFLPEGRISLRAGSGTQLTETWFDNIRVTSLNIPDPTPTPTPEPTPIPAIVLPYFSQENPEWASNQYDSTNKTISELGCALTATAMVLQYHGINKIPDQNGNLVFLTPLSLNQWFVNNEMYAKDGGLVFPKVAALSKKLIQQLKESGDTYAFEAFEYQQFKSFVIPTNDYERIDRYLTNYLHPLIFKEISGESSSGSHFVVGTKVIESGVEYQISDPVDENRTSIMLPPDQLQKVVYLRPSNTDLSYLFFQFESILNVSILTPKGIVSVQESAPDSASLVLGTPISAENSADSSGLPVWEFDYKYPPNGEYLVHLTSFSDGFFEPWLYFFDKQGKNYEEKLSYFVSSSLPTTLKINYDSENIDSIKVSRLVSWNDVLNDIDALARMGSFKNHGVPQSLRSNLIDAMNKYADDPSQSFRLLDLLTHKIINSSSLLILNEQARNLLVEDIKLLQDSLQ